MRRVLVVIALAAFIWTPETLAKGSGRLEVCGLTGCATLGDEAQSPVRVQAGPLDAPISLDLRVAPSAPAPFYTLRSTSFWGTIGYWIPSAGLLRLGQLTSQWVAALPDESAALALATLEIEPHPPPRTAVTAVDFKPSNGGRTYLRLYMIGTPTVTWPGAGGWLRIFVVGAMTPWTDGANSLWISRRGAFLRRDGTTVLISPSTASRIRRGLPLG